MRLFQTLAPLAFALTVPLLLVGCSSGLNVSTSDGEIEPVTGGEITVQEGVPSLFNSDSELLQLFFVEMERSDTIGYARKIYYDREGRVSFLAFPKCLSPAATTGAVDFGFSKGKFKGDDAALAAITGNGECRENDLLPPSPQDFLSLLPSIEKIRMDALKQARDDGAVLQFAAELDSGGLSFSATSLDLPFDGTYCVTSTPTYVYNLSSGELVSHGNGRDGFYTNREPDGKNFAHSAGDCTLVPSGPLFYPGQ